MGKEAWWAWWAVEVVAGDNVEVQHEQPEMALGYARDPSGLAAKPLSPEDTTVPLPAAETIST